MGDKMDNTSVEQNENLKRIAYRKQLVVDAQDEDELRALMKPNVARFNVHLGLHTLVWLLAAAGIFYFDHWAWLALCVIVLGNQLHGFTILQHECGHRNAYRHDGWNRFVGCALAWFIIMPYTTFKECHRRHHRYLGDPEHDPDEWNYTGGRARWIPVRIATFVPRFIFMSLTRYTQDVRNKVITELTFNLVTWAALIGISLYMDMLNEFLLIFALPLLLLAAVINPLSRGYEHWPLARIDEKDRDSRLDIAKTTISVTHPFISWIWANINYHVEHHVYPGVPFYNLPRVAKLMEKRRYLRHRHLLQDIFTKTDCGLASQSACSASASLHEVDHAKSL